MKGLDLLLKTDFLAITTTAQAKYVASFVCIVIAVKSARIVLKVRTVYGSIYLNMIQKAGNCMNYVVEWFDKTSWTEEACGVRRRSFKTLRQASKHAISFKGIIFKKTKVKVVKYETVWERLSIEK